jgi:signal transduction histidine kinase/CheY-like chemotaxis protein
MTKNVLLIEDDAGYREAIVRRCEREGYRFLEADSPRAGIRALEANPHVRVILMDLSFPDQPGTVVLDHIRPRSDHYRVIILTAHDELLAAERARDYDVFNYLPKADHSTHQALRFSLDQAFKDLERAALANKIGVLQEVQGGINDGQEITKTLDLICRSVREIVDAYTCHIRVYDFASGDFHLMGFAPDGPLRNAFGLTRSKGQLFSGRVVESGVSEFHDDVQHDEKFLALKGETLAKREMPPEAAEYWDAVSSAYIVPISTGLFGDAVDAVLNVSSESSGFFTPENRALVDEFAQQAGLAITREWLQRKHQELHEDYAHISHMLGDIRDRLAGPDALLHLYAAVTRNLAAIVCAEVVSIFLYDGRTQRIVNVAEYCGTEHARALDEEYEIGQSFVGRVFESGETLLLQTWDGVEPRSDPRFDHGDTERYQGLIPSGTLEHYLAVPIKAGGQFQGVLRVMNKKSAYYDEVIGEGASSAPRRSVRFALLERGFTPDARNVVETTASHLAIAIQNARLLEERNRRLQQLQTLGEVGRIISSELDIGTVLEQTIHAMAMVMRAEICMLFLRVESENRVVLRECYGIPELELAGASYNWGEGVTGMVAASGTARLVTSAELGDGKYDAQIQRYLTLRDGRPREIKSLMVVPIVARSTILGVMKVINKVGDDPHFSPSDLQLFETLGQYVGVAIGNANVYELTNTRLAVAERGAILSDLVRAVAHEINNTSGLIPANVHAIRKTLGPVAASIEPRLRLIDDVANQATEFANEITGFSATRRGMMRALDVNAVIRTALQELAREKYTARLTTRFADQPLVCEIYERPFKQIVRNIIINAFQALERTDAGVLTVSTTPGQGPLEGCAVIEFQDNGPGIRPKHLERIFEADFTTKTNGNGIGLWLVRKQLELLEGTIGVASEPGRGAHFTITIPLAPKAVEPGGE